MVEDNVKLEFLLQISDNTKKMLSNQRAFAKYAYPSPSGDITLLITSYPFTCNSLCESYTINFNANKRDS